MINEARKVATEAHRGQVDKAGNAYIHHPERVVGHLLEGGAHDEAVVVGWLHDVVEDTPVSLEDLRAQGFSETVVAAVDAITKREGEEKEDYYARVKADPIALEVKLADIRDNSDPARLALLDEPTRERLEEKYRKALRFLGG